LVFVPSLIKNHYHEAFIREILTLVPPWTFAFL